MGSRSSRDVTSPFSFAYGMEGKAVTHKRRIVAGTHASPQAATVVTWLEGNG